ncbi:MAG: hypothetical protein FWD48_02380 [Oscillospiraceae bacterium]|nr:hypothetical protein [Oscillospiraceae bacterium]
MMIQVNAEKLTKLIIKQTEEAQQKPFVNYNSWSYKAFMKKNKQFEFARYETKKWGSWTPKNKKLFGKGFKGTILYTIEIYSVLWKEGLLLIPPPDLSLTVYSEYYVSEFNRAMLEAGKNSIVDIVKMLEKNNIRVVNAQIV